MIKQAYIVSASAVCSQHGNTKNLSFVLSVSQGDALLQGATNLINSHPNCALVLQEVAAVPVDNKEIVAAAEESLQGMVAEREWKGSFQRPVTAEISDVFGVQRVFNGAVQSTHQGLDFRVPTGTPVAAVNSGTVILAQSLYFEGDCIVIDHGQGLLTLYLHLSEMRVQEGERVVKGQPIGLSGGIPIVGNA